MLNCCGLFGALYREVGHVGSNYDNLRLDGAGDYDLNLVLKVDIIAPHIRLESGREVWPGYVNVVVQNWDDIRIPENHALFGYGTCIFKVQWALW